MTIRSTPRRRLTLFGHRPSAWILGVLALSAGRLRRPRLRPGDRDGDQSRCLSGDRQRRDSRPSPPLAPASPPPRAASAASTASASAALLSPDLPIRKEQACLGITIAAAGLQQAEWETRYAVARTYWSVLYARAQLKVVDGVIEKLSSSTDKAKGFVEGGRSEHQGDADRRRQPRAQHPVRQGEAVPRWRPASRRRLRGSPRGDRPVPQRCAHRPRRTACRAWSRASTRRCLVQWALTKRGEMAQAAAAAQVAELEISAQQRLIFRPVTNTFAAGADLHAKQIPQGDANGEFVPGAIGLEMPTTFVGHHPERTERAADFATRAQAVVEKTTQPDHARGRGGLPEVGRGGLRRSRSSPALRRRPPRRPRRCRAGSTRGRPRART